MVRDRGFYKTFFTLALTVGAQSVISLGVNLADNIMLGRYSELAISGASLVNQLQFVMQMLVFGVSGGVVILAAQYWGKRDVEPIRRIVSVGMKFAIAVGAIFLLVTRLFPEQCVRLLTNEEAVIREGVDYLKILCWTFLLFAVSNSLVLSLRAVETAFIGALISVVTMFSNIGLNYCLIFGHLGFPAMGIRGAAIATLVSRVIELIIVLVYVLFFDKKLRLRLKDIFGWDMTYLKDYFHAALPQIGSGAAWGFAQAAQSAILGRMGETAIAANSIASVVFSVVVIISNAMASSANVVIGKTVGSGRHDLVRAYTKTMQVLFIVSGLLSGAILYLLKGAAVRLYGVSPATEEMAIKFLTVLSVTIIGTSYEHPVAGGIVSGGGNPRYTFVMDALFMWVLVLPLSAISAFLLDAPPLIVFCCLKCDQILKVIPHSIYGNSFKWIRTLTRDKAEITE